MDKILIWLINLYQKIPLRSHTSCVFLPTCSQYSKEAIDKYGSVKGTYLSIIRIFKCHPWQKNHYDPVK